MMPSAEGPVRIVRNARQGGHGVRVEDREISRLIIVDAPDDRRSWMRRVVGTFSTVTRASGDVQDSIANGDIHVAQTGVEPASLNPD